jgi:hypothetical protein
MTEHGFTRDTNYGTYFKQEERGVFFEGHMDDVHATGAYPGLSWFAVIMEEMFKVRSAIHGIHEADYEHLRRRRRRTPYGTFITAGAHHLEHLMALFGFNERTTTKPTPLPSNVDVGLDDGTNLEIEDHTTYGRGVGLFST